MTFLELCNFMLKRVDRAHWNLDDVAVDPTENEHLSKVVSFIADAYRDIQLMSRYWRFAHQRTLLFTTSSGTQDYSATVPVRKLIRDSVVAQNAALATDEWDVEWMKYEDWRDRFLAVQLSETRPIWITDLPSGQYRMSPPPDGAYKIYADRTSRVDALEINSDEPLWDEDLHDVVAFYAIVHHYRFEYEVSENAANRAARSLALGLGEMQLRYLPDLTNASRFE